jgi:release factor glutamine methyltransferase
MRLTELLKCATTELKRADIVEYELEARLLLEACLGKTRTEIFLDGQEEVSEAKQKQYLDMVVRRKTREPLAYILGVQEFWSMPFSVTPAVLIPRPETEFLLDRVLALAEQTNLRRGHILDLCCGCGVIAAVLAKETGQRVIASDISRLALEVAVTNLRQHHLAGLVDFVQSDLLTAFSNSRVFSLIVSNPPYVSSFALQNNLEPEVANYEPGLALDGGEMGLELIYKIRRELPKLLCPGGQYFMEIGAEQGAAVEKLFSAPLGDSPGFQQVDILVDYADRDRVLHARMVDC